MAVQPRQPYAHLYTISTSAPTLYALLVTFMSGSTKYLQGGTQPVSQGPAPAPRPGSPGWEGAHVCIPREAGQGDVEVVALLGRGILADGVVVRRVGAHRERACRTGRMGALAGQRGGRGPGQGGPESEQRLYTPEAGLLTQLRVPVWATAAVARHAAIASHLGPAILRPAPAAEAPQVSAVPTTA